MNKIVVSISRLNKELFLMHLDKEDIVYKEESSFNDNLNSYIINNIENDERNEVISRPDYIDDLSYFVYERKTEPDWSQYILEQINNDEVSLINTHSSYLILYTIKDNVYVLTSGLANNIISDFKDNNFGIRMLTKLYENSSAVIRAKTETVVGGKRSTQAYANRSETSFDVEKEINTISKGLTLIADKDIQLVLGIIDEDNYRTSQDINISFGNNIEITKKLDVDQIFRVISNIDVIDSDNTNIKFAIDNISLIEKFGFKQTEVREEYFKCLDEQINTTDYNFRIYSNQLNNSPSNILINSTGNKIKGIGDDGNLTKSQIEIFILESIKKPLRAKTVLGYKLKSQKDDNEVLVSLYDILEDTFIYLGREMHLIEGKWYTFDENYSEFYRKLFKEFYSKSITFTSNDFSLESLGYDIKEKDNESEFNISLKDNDNIIYSDQIRYYNIELADAIYPDKENNRIIIFHNKRFFNGSHVRDVVGQIKTSAEVISTYRITKDEEMIKYISKLRDKNEKTVELVDDFIDLIKNNATTIVYLACFVDQVNKDTNSSYITYMISDLEKELSLYNFNFYIF